MERGWLPVCFLLMQAAWMGALGEVASARFGGHGVLLGLPTAIATLFAGYTAGRRLLRRDVPAAGAPIAMLALGLVWSVGAVWLGRHLGEDVTWLEALPGAARGAWGAPLADALALAATFALWWHGQRTGQTPPEHDSAVRAFGLGALVFGAALLWAAGVRPAPLALTPAILLFLGAGLPALSLARLKEVRRDLQSNVVRGEPARLDAAWWRTLVPPMAGVLIAAALAALVLSDDAWRGAILGALGAAGNLAMAALYVPVLLVGFVAEWLIYALRSLSQEPAAQQALPPVPGGGAELLGELQSAPPSANYLETFRWVALALGAALVLALFLLSSRTVRRAREGVGVGAPEREALSTWTLLLDDLRSLWRALLRRVRARAAALAGTLPLPGVDVPPASDAADAREAYRELLTLGRSNALPRRPHETPDEYLTSWAAALPAEAEAGELTAAYVRARYGPPAPAPPAASRLRALLGQIRAALVTFRSRATRA